MINLIWDSENKTIRGSFVNLVITFVVLILIVISILSKEYCENFNKIGGLIITFSTLSLGIWAGKRVLESGTDLNDK